MVRIEMAVIVAVSVFLLTVVVSWLLLKQVIAVCYHHNIFDTKDERKIHKGDVPRMGGIVFFPSVAIALLLVTLVGSLMGYRDVGDMMILKGPKLIAIFCAMFIMYVFGFIDDFKGLRFRTKFVSQIMAGLTLCIADLWIHDLHGIFGLHAISPWIGYPITIFAIIFVINALNFIDGIDGQASSISIMSLTYYIIIFLCNRWFDFGMLGLSFIAAILPFLLYNLTGSVKRENKIFMGDTGSTVLGLVMVIMGIEMNDMLVGERHFNPMVVAFAPMILPCYDVIRVVIQRIRSHKSPFKPDSTHVHHKLLAILKDQHKVLPVVLTMAVAMMLITILLSIFINVNLTLLISLVIWFAADYKINKLIKTK